VIFFNVRKIFELYVEIIDSLKGPVIVSLKGVLKTEKNLTGKKN